MTRHSSQGSGKELDEAKTKLENLKMGWSETLNNWVLARTEKQAKDLFSTIDYLTFCDQLCTNMILDFKEMDLDLNNLADLRKKSPLSPNHLVLIEDLAHQMQEIKNHMQNIMQEINTEYSILAENTLRRTQDLIAKYSETMQQETTTPALQTDVHQNLEKELFLQELSDSLESYRQAREDFIAESEKASTPQSSAELIEKKLEMDSIIAQIDAALAACDTALLIKETTD
jgi:hypothetical protein